MKYRLLLFFFLIYGFCFAQNHPNTILWEVSKKGINHKSYLFGTFHQVNPLFFDSLKNTNQKFETVTALFVERVIKANQPIDTAALREMFSWNPEKWNTVLDAEQKGIFSRFVEKAHDSIYYAASPVNLYFRMLNLYFQNVCDRAFRKSYQLMDDYIVQKAKEKNLNVTSLDENVLQLIQDAAKKDSLLSIRENVKNSMNLMNKMLENDKSGCEFLTSYKNFTIDYALNQKLKGLDALLSDRNDLWMKVLPIAIVRQSSFIAVGIKHLFYKDGLIQKLRKAGFKVVPISAN